MIVSVSRHFARTFARALGRIFKDLARDEWKDADEFPTTRD
jgi:hypothetical protein